MEKQQYINILETVVLRNFPCYLKQLTPPQFLFKDFAYIFRPFVFKNSQVSLLSSETFIRPSGNQIYVQRQQQEIKRKVRDIFKVNNKDTTSISIVRLNRYLFAGHAVSAKVSQPALVYSKSLVSIVDFEQVKYILGRQ